jgi:hypothetical protein
LPVALGFFGDDRFGSWKVLTALIDRRLGSGVQVVQIVQKDAIEQSDVGCHVAR